MTATWNRQVSLTFDDPNGDGVIDLSAAGAVLNIGFTVERNLDTEPSTMTATVHNLNRDTQEKLANVKGWTVELIAGYGTDPDYDYIYGNTNSIFKGSVRFVRHRREPPLFATDIEADCRPRLDRWQLKIEPVHIDGVYQDQRIQRRP